MVRPIHQQEEIKKDNRRTNKRTPALLGGPLQAASRGLTIAMDKAKTASANLFSLPPRGKSARATEDIVAASTQSIQPTLPKRTLLETRNSQSFMKNIDNTLKYLCTEQQLDELMIPDEITRLNEKITSATKALSDVDHRYDTNSVWTRSEIFINRLEETLSHLKSASIELKHYIPCKDDPHQRSYSLESLESYTGEKEYYARVLLVGIQGGYDAIQGRFHDFIHLVKEGFYGASIEMTPSSYISITRLSQTVSYLDALVDFEKQHKIDPQFSIVINQRLVQERQQGMIAMFGAFCCHLMLIQETLFLMEHLYAKRGPSIKKLRGMAEVMKKGWSETTLAMKRFTSVYPSLTETAHEQYGRLLWHAASLISKMQDGDDVQQFLEHGRSIRYDPEIVRDVTTAQLWLLPCVDLLVKLINRMAYRLKSRMKTMVPKAKPNPLIGDLKRVMYDLAMTTIARSCWLNSYTDASSLSMLTDLREQGYRTLAFVLEYNRSYRSLNCNQDSTPEDVSCYSAMVSATNELRNGVLRLHGWLQTREYSREDPLAHADDLDNDTGPLKFHDVDGIRPLTTQISIKPYPVTLEECSIEWESESSTDQIMYIRARGSADSSLVSPWVTDASMTDEDDESNPTSPFAAGPMIMTPPNPSVSVESIELRTEFKNEITESGEVDSAYMMDNTHVRDSLMEYNLIIGSLSPKERMMDRSPFSHHQPTEMPAEATSGGWGSVPSHARDDSGVLITKMSSGYVEAISGLDLTSKGSLEVLGKGSEGHVLKMFHHQTPVAVKIMNNASHLSREKFKNETKLMSKLTPHLNIVNFVGKCEDLRERKNAQPKVDLVMVLEFCDLGNLYKTISEARWIRQLHDIGRQLDEFQFLNGYLLFSDWRRRIQIACDIAAGAAHLHQHGICHRDLTSFNIVLKEDQGKQWIAKICDFERSRYIPKNQTIPRSDNLANSPAWSAPEILRNDCYSVQADVFSFGVILWELWTLEEPWKVQDQQEHYIQNSMLIIPRVSRGDRLKIPSDTDLPFGYKDELASLIESCWNEDPLKRPTMQRAYEILLSMKEKLHQ